jgi:hypothetical protein
LPEQTTILIQQLLKQTERVHDNKNDKLKVAKKTLSKTVLLLLLLLLLTANRLDAQLEALPKRK